MNQATRVNRGLRCLGLDQYDDSQPELVIANITKLRLLQSLDLDLVYLPFHPGTPHDGAVRIPQDSTQPERLIWFDFMVLIEDEPGVAGRPGTLTMAESAYISPAAFYVVLFPKQPGYMAVIPHDVAWQEREGTCYDVNKTGITGPYLPYLLPEHAVPTALARISMIPWGASYINPGTGVVLNQWFPAVTESPRDTPALLAHKSQRLWTTLPPKITAKRRRRNSDEQQEVIRPAPALRQIDSGAGSTEDDLFDLDWLSADPLTFNALPEFAGVDFDGVNIFESQPLQEYIYFASSQVGFPHVDSSLPESWIIGYQGESAQSNAAPTTVSTVPEDSEWFLPTAQAGPATILATSAAPAQPQSRFANLRALAPAPLAMEAGPRQVSQSAASVHSSAKASRSSTSAVSPHDAQHDDFHPELEDDGDDDEETTLPPHCLLELHPHHPWCNHIYLPASPQDVLTQLLTPETICAPVLTNYTHTDTPSRQGQRPSTPISRLATTHSCIHILTCSLEPTTYYVFPSRWLDFFTSNLNSLLNGTHSDSKKSALRGGNKILTENPTVADLLRKFYIGAVKGGQGLRGALMREFQREVGRKTPVGITREEDGNACCSVKEILQAQVDWAMGLGREDWHAR